MEEFPTAVAFDSVLSEMMVNMCVSEIDNSRLRCTPSSTRIAQSYVVSQVGYDLFFCNNIFISRRKDFAYIIRHCIPLERQLEKNKRANLTIFDVTSQYNIEFFSDVRVEEPVKVEPVRPFLPTSQIRNLVSM